MTQYIGKTSPGAAVVLVKGGKIIFSKGYGYADLEKGTMVDAAGGLDRSAHRKEGQNRYNGWRQFVRCP
ncbi:MAG: serine hydrolase [Desulfitobacteriaceae bacterium]|nr:serine hydrolase [Desulfitobacteriaceae bacterium]